MPDPILWTKLGSTPEIETPEFGTFSSRSGFVDFRACKFDNGASGSAAGDNIIYNTTWPDPTKGSVEFWVKFVTQDIVNGYYTPAVPTSQRGTFVIGNGTATGSILMLIYSSTFPTLGHKVFGVGFATAVTCTNVNITKNNPYHIAVTWDNAGIAGSPDKLRLYINGVVCGSTAVNSAPSTINSIKVGNFWNNSYSFYSPSGYECAMDNVKVWDYAKTDFSDRFTEGVVSAAKRLFSNKYFGGI